MKRGEISMRIIDLIPVETAHALAELAEQLRVDETKQLETLMETPPAPPAGLAFHRTASGRLRKGRSPL